MGAGLSVSLHGMLGIVSWVGHAVEAMLMAKQVLWKNVDGITRTSRRGSAKIRLDLNLHWSYSRKV